MTVLIAIQRDIVKAHGANAAIIHQQIQWVIEYGTAAGVAHKPGWFTGTSEQLSDLSGLSPDACRRAMTKLLEAGLMSKAKFRSSQGDQTCSYRPTNPTVSADGDSAESGDRENTGCGDGENTGCTSASDDESKTSPTPPEEGGQPELFGAADRGASKRSEKKRKGSVPEGLTDPLWKAYPSESGKGKGSKKAAVRAMTKAMQAGSTSGELLEAVEHYHAARSAYRERWPGHDAPLMNASTFFNGKHEMFNHEWADDDLRYWPPPPGRSWDTKRRRTVEEILADKEAS